MRKLKVMLLAGLMTLGMGMTAMATEYIDESVVTIEKSYTKTEGSTGTTPGSTFYLYQDSKDGYTSSKERVAQDKIPDLVTIAEDSNYVASATLDDGVASGNFAITLPAANQYPNVGEYTYVVKEVTPETKIAGVTYSAQEIEFTVHILRGNGTDPIDANNYIRVVVASQKVGEDGYKISVVKNTYSAHKLTIDKTVTGSLGDKTKDFTFTVAFTGPNGEAWEDAIEVNGANAVEGSASTYTFTLTDGDTHEFSNIPDGVIYTVTETTDNDYRTYVGEGEDKEETYTATGAFDAKDEEVHYTNESKIEVDTGISLDSLPYIMIMVIAVVGLAVVATRRRAVR